MNTELLRSAIDKGIIKGITERTACTWLEKLGFEHKYATKNTFVDGHERSDVVAHRKNYIKAFREFEKNKNAIFMFQDEVCYHANMCEFKQWCEKDRTQKQLLQKSQGQGVMVSAFINETDGFLELTDGQLQKCNEQRQKAGKVPLPDGASNSMRRIVIGIAHDGYWNGDNQLCQTDEIIDMFQAKYPTKKAIFVFDNSAGHMKKPVDAIRIDKMAKGWGGVGGDMRATKILEDCGIFKAGESQSLVFLEGEHPDPKARPVKADLQGHHLDKLKGCVQLLIERRGYEDGMTLAQCRAKLLEYPDLAASANPKPALQELVEGRGHYFLSLPKFHCELNPIERCWAQSKRYCRQNCGFSLESLFLFFLLNQQHNNNFV